jgi:hypothetical protein
MIKGFLKGMLDVLLSTRTALWLLAAGLALLAAGALEMPAMDEYRGMNSAPLFRWLSESPLKATWWLWGLIGVLALLALNTLFCSAESLIRKGQGRHWVLLISPQVMHAGFLLILLAHLFSSAGAERWVALAGEGSSFRLPNDTVLRVEKINLKISPSGRPLDWSADVAYFTPGLEKLASGFVAPNRPSFFKGLGLYIKDIRPGGMLYIEVSREPGAPWALAGGVLFTAGTIALVLLKIRKES